MNFTKFLFAMMFAASMSFAMVGCEEEGPAERAGEDIDRQTENTREEMNDKAREAGEEIEEAGDEMNEDLKDATDND